MIDPASVRVRDGWRETLWAFLGARVLLAAIGVIGGGMLALPPGQPPTDAGFPNPALAPGWHMLFTSLQRQDAQWFLRLATTGYSPGDHSAAFFPGFPVSMRLVHLLPGVGPLAAGVVVANVAAFSALLLLHALTRYELGDGAARRAVLFTALFPTAFFLYAPYTESLFLLASIATFWFARRDRWVLAAAAGAVAAATRSVGILLILALWVEAIAQQRRDGRALLPRLAAAAAVALGPLLYFGWWQWRYGDFWAPLDAQRAWRPGGAHQPVEVIVGALQFAWRYQSWWLLDVTVVALAVTGVALAVRRIPLTYIVYASASLALPLLLPLESRPLLSMPRFAAVLFPVSWGWAIAAARRRPPETAILVAFVGGFALLAYLFINWQPVF
ncbi:MAG: mannosyltransferase family protein [Actinomycetota bacterium]